MPPFDFAAARAQIEEYETRSHLAKRRAPTEPGEKPEQEGWASRVETRLVAANKIKVGLTADQIWRLKETEISDEQLRFFDENKIEPSEDKFLVDDDGNVIGLYLNHGFKLPWDDEAADEILDELERGTQSLVDHFPPPGKDKKDKRFQKDFEEYKKRCDENGYQIGLYHFGYRRENGVPKGVPVITKETIMSGMSHRYKAVIKFYKTLTAVKQTIGMVYQMAFPKEGENALEIVQHWKNEDPGFGALVHTPRETATYFVLNVNCISEPHVDPCNSETTFTAMHFWGDFDIENGGHLALPIFNRSYRMERDSMFFLKASLIRHHVTRSKVMSGQRFSAVHITQDNIGRFEDMVEPPTPAQKKEWQSTYKVDDKVKECPFCQAPMAGSAAVNAHLYKIIEKGGDELHKLEATKKWSDDKKKETLAARRARSNKRKADALESAGGADDNERDGNQLPVEKPKKVQRGKTVKFSSKYEQFGKELYDENENENEKTSQENEAKAVKRSRR